MSAITTPAAPEDNFPTTPPPSSNLTPLARAALLAGVDFDDVIAYALHAHYEAQRKASKP